jgi:hypothetical protein
MSRLTHAIEIHFTNLIGIMHSTSDSLLFLFFSSVSPHAAIFFIQLSKQLKSYWKANPVL